MAITPLSRRNRQRTFAPTLFDWRARDASRTARTGHTVAITRAGAAWGTATDGTLYPLAHSQPAWHAVDLDGDGTREALGLLLELARTNLLSSPFAPATQTVSLDAGTYTLTVWGSGSCTLSGGPVGTATQGHPMGFVLDATTSVTFTVAGTLSAFQCEAAGFGTSPISGTRALGYARATYRGAPQAAIHYTRFQDRGTGQVASARVWEIGTSGNRLRVSVNPDTGRYRATCETALGTITSQVNDDLVLAYTPGGVVGLTATRASTGVFAASADTTDWPTVELLLVQDATGAIRLAQSTDGADVMAGTMSSALAFPTTGAYGATTLTFNADGAAGNAGAIALLDHRILPYQASTHDALTDQQLMDLLREM